MALATMKKIAPARPGTIAGPKRNGLVQLNSTSKKPFPSAPQAKRTVMGGGGPALAGAAPKKPGNAIRIIRGPGMARRAGTPKTGLRSFGTVKRIQKARKNLRTATGRKVIDTKGPGKIIKTKGRTVIRTGHGKRIIVTKRGSVVKGKRGGGFVTRTKLIGMGGNPYARTKTVTKHGTRTATKADDWTGVKRSGQKGAFLRVKKGGKTVVVARRKATPNRLRVKTTVGGKTTTRVVGPKFTKTTGPGGKTTTKKTRMLTKEQSRKTARVGQKGWAQAGSNLKGALPTHELPNKPPKKKAPGKVHGSDWKRVRTIRARRRRTGARNRLSYTKSQLKNVTSRRY